MPLAFYREHPNSRTEHGQFTDSHRRHVRIVRWAAVTDHAFPADPESQRRLERLLDRLRAHCRAAVAQKRRAELQLVVVIEPGGRISRDSRIHLPAEFVEDKA